MPEPLPAPVPSPRLVITLCGMAMRNPVMAASGTFGYGIEFEKIVNLNDLGALVTKGLSREPIAGNPAPRLWHTESGMMNSVGLQNVGVRAFVAEKLPRLRDYKVPVIANVFGYSIDDYLEVVRVLENSDGIAAYELNVSCPNTKEGGIFFSSDPHSLATLIDQVRPVSRRPIIVKLSPNVAKIQPFAQTAEQSGADAVSLVNTFIGLAIDIETRKPRIGAGFGGLSGPAIKPLALRMVYEASRCVKIPIIGLGGIVSGEDAAEFLIAGATAVQVGTGSFIRPDAPVQVARQLGKLISKLKLSHIRDLTGTINFER